MGNAILHVSAAILDTHQLKARLAPLGLLIAIQLPGHVVSELPTRIAKLQSRYPGEQFALIILDKGSYTNGEVHQLEGTIAQLSVPVLALIPVSPNDRPENTLTGKPAKLFLTRMTGPIIISLAVRIMLYGTESLPPTDYGALARALHFPKSNWCLPLPRVSVPPPVQEEIAPPPAGPVCVPMTKPAIVRPKRQAKPPKRRKQGKPVFPKTVWVRVGKKSIRFEYFPGLILKRLMTTPDESITVRDLMKFPHSPYRDPGDLGYTIRHIKDTLLTHGIYSCQVRADDAYGYVFHWLA